MYFLNSYKPLCYTKEGREATKRFEFPPFIDASCRREPDFQSKYPSISALCRIEKFVPRLNIGDSVVYITKKGNYKPESFPHWRLTAILKVLQMFQSHKDAAQWYQDQGLPLPSNCMVAENKCLPYEMTGGASKDFMNIPDIEERLRKWDLEYQRRRRICGIFIACEATFLKLYDPPILTIEQLHDIFGKTPGTQNPKQITEEQFIALLPF
ncbi:MAG TPA: hypothetical protein VGB02_12290 [Pyrinomonadaceae bacterium]|jgi:hypothetical protein